MITMDFTFGDIYHIFEKALDIAENSNDVVKFEFNGVWFAVHKGSEWCDDVHSDIMWAVENQVKCTVMV